VGNDLFAPFSLKLLQALLCLGVALARSSAKQDASLVAVPGNALSMPVHVGELKLGAGVPLFDGDPKQLDHLGTVCSCIFVAKKLQSLLVFRLARFLPGIGSSRDRNA
jgi:hypothetical protein